ncbi:hypothetical protein FOPE_10902 [Fonsecaea pedrosoi]|nr:hypothetical protein FOPE_10902 [Fonsecaea pedrosoi]
MSCTKDAITNGWEYMRPLTDRYYGENHDDDPSSNTARFKNTNDSTTEAASVCMGSDFCKRGYEAILDVLCVRVQDGRRALPHYAGHACHAREAEWEATRVI